MIYEKKKKKIKVTYCTLHFVSNNKKNKLKIQLLSENRVY